MRPSGFDKPLHGRSLADLIEDTTGVQPDAQLDEVELKADVTNALGQLESRESDVLSLRFGLKDGRQRTLEEIGHLFKVTRERIRQIETKAIKKLKNPVRAKALVDYL